MPKKEKNIFEWFALESPYKEKGTISIVLTKFINKDNNKVFCFIKLSILTSRYQTNGLRQKQEVPQIPKLKPVFSTNI